MSKLMGAPRRTPQSSPAVTEAIRFLKGDSAVARMAGVTVYAVGKWRRKLPAHRVLWLAAKTDWQFTPHQLCPQLYPNPADALPVPPSAAQPLPRQVGAAFFSDPGVPMSFQIMRRDAAMQDPTLTAVFGSDLHHTDLLPAGVPYTAQPAQAEEAGADPVHAAPASDAAAINTATVTTVDARRVRSAALAAAAAVIEAFAREAQQRHSSEHGELAEAA